MGAAIVAGVGPGLGGSLARALAKNGYPVALISRRPESSEPVANLIRANGGNALIVPADVTQPQAVQEAVAKIRQQLGPVTTLAYNASGYGRGPFLELDPETIRRSFEVGAMGAVYLAQATIPDMLAAGQGFISLTGATAALRGRAGYAPLAIAKSSLRILGQSLAREFHPQGIHVVHVIVDGQIDTPKLRARDPQRSPETVIPPDSIAETILHLMHQPRGAWTHEIDIRPYVEPF
ncbi:MAG TPA: SDR family NAD(P)-dependent oxidoreductase [Candidatus Binatia bacterium]|nr:SDR family NAD(P)-dependent oxidoreductase [Candidatus Binatia bacterium]